MQAVTTISCLFTLFNNFSVLHKEYLVTDGTRKCSDNKHCMIRHIANILARHMLLWVIAGDKVQAGDTFGMIRFGSRVEIFLPEDITLEIGLGQHILAGQTVLGRWTAPW